jgi:signal recognition particle subunit SRP54
VDLNDFRRHIVKMKKMGSVREAILKVPGLNLVSVDSGRVDYDREISRIEAIIDSTTLDERTYPDLLADPNRRLRVAGGAGVELDEVSRFFTQVQKARDIMRRFRPRG